MRPIMSECDNRAGTAAFWLIHGRLCVGLLRAHGRGQQAENLQDALDEVMEILAVALGREALARAMDRTAAGLWDCDDGGFSAPSRH
jgi:hypothetical protein